MLKVSNSCVRNGALRLRSVQAYVKALCKKRLMTVRPNPCLGTPKIYSNRMAFTGEIFVMI